MFTRFFIDRPIFATVLSVLLVLSGALARSVLPVAQYPEITPPTVEVYAVYPGANCQVVADTVAAPIEQQVNGVEEMMYMSSQCTNDGTYILTVTFNPGVDLNIAQVLVQNRVNLAQPVLPDLVKRRGVTVKKKSPSQLMIINLFSPDGSKTNLDLSNYATINLRDELARLPGVGDITYLGQRDYSMRLWLDPEKLATRGLTATDVVNAVSQQNAQVAAGQVGQPPAPTTQSFQYPINTLGRLAVPEQFANMILKATETGTVVRVRDVVSATQYRSVSGENQQPPGVELGALSYDQTCTLDGKPSVALSVYQLPGTNALETARKVKEKMKELETKFPSGMKYDIVYDTTPFIEESVNEVFQTLRDAIVLVAIVMLVFLQSWRAAIIPLAAVPVAIVGTFAAMLLLGYSINNLTLFGLVLAVGIVVDDAIVVVEAVQHHVEHGMSPRLATAKAMDEVAGPVVAVGLVLTAVFVPCVFVSGIVGQFFKQFAVTIAVSTLISAFNSLTLSPALCALLLKPTKAGEPEPPLPKLAIPLLGAGLAYWYLADLIGAYLRSMNWPELAPLISWVAPVLSAVPGALAGWAVSARVNQILGWGFYWFNAGFNFMTAGYISLVRWAIRLAVLVLLGYAGLLYLTQAAIVSTPTGFIPQQDKGYLLVNVQLPDAAAVGRTESLMHTLEAIASQTPGVNHTLTVSGQSVLLGANASNFGTLYVILHPFPDRLAPDLHADAIAEKLQKAFNEQVNGAQVNVFGAPPVDGLGTAGGFKIVIEDPSGTGATDMENAGRRVVDSANDSPYLKDAFTGFRADTPWLYLDIDRTAAQARGVSMAEIINTLQVNLGSLYVNDLNLFGRTFQVNLQADEKFRKRIENVLRLKVKSGLAETEKNLRIESRKRDGQPADPADEAREIMIPIGEFVRLRMTTGPVMIQRYNLYPSVVINASPREGISSGQAIAALEQTADDEKSPGLQRAWTELAFLQLQTKDTATKAFVLSVLLVFLVLAAQYESWSLPLAVILVVPMCLLSAVIGVRVAEQDINIFTQIGFVVLVGLACKNAILIIEFAKHRREAGTSPRQAALEACGNFASGRSS